MENVTNHLFKQLNILQFNKGCGRDGETLIRIEKVVTVDWNQSKAMCLPG